MEKPIEAESTRYEDLPVFGKVIFLVLAVYGIGIGVFYLFRLKLAGLYLYEVAYYYLFIGTFLACVYLILPARKKDRGKGLPWYDLLAAAYAFGVGIYFFTNAWAIGDIGWIPPSTFNFALALIYCILLLDAGRRMGGPFYLAVCLIIGSYPLYADHMPGVFFGTNYSFIEVVGRNIFGFDGMLGIPSTILAGLILGFLVFAAVLIASGAGKFFLDLAQALLGSYRGGPAKVAVLASGFFGSLSGSPFSNIVSTGCVTIPAMKRLGYPSYYAAAIEACASQGGMLMPPVMGALAFVMCAFLGVDYAVLIVIAAIPSLLFYFGLLMQVDAYAARTGLRGLPREELPSLTKTLKRGWPFITVLFFLIWGLVYMKWSIHAPFYGAGLMLLLSFGSRETMMTPKKFIQALAEAGKLAAQATAIIIPIGFVLIGLVQTGVAASITSMLLRAGAGNIFLILAIGVIACYILGMVGVVAVAYIFLAVSMAPAVIQVAGLNELAVHFFILYYTMMAGITLPVAPAAFLAATLAGSGPMRTAVTAMRLGVVVYFIPFFFVFNPSLILQGSLLDAAYLFALCMLGILFIAAGLEGYLVKIGRIGLWARPLLIIAGLLIGFPEWNTTFIGAAIAALVIAAILVRQKRVLKTNS